MAASTPTAEETDARAGRPTMATTVLRRPMVILFAMSCGVLAANLYYAQPVLVSIARSFGVGSGAAGLVVTASQIGYAVGLGLLVPLGDMVSRRLLIGVVLAITAAALVASAAAPSLDALIGSALIVGLCSVAAQVLVPMAASLAEEDHRGRVVGTVMSGLLIGILLARTVSGVIAQFSSWRVTYVVAAALTGALALFLGARLPSESPRPSISYPALLGSTVRLFAKEPVLRSRSLLGALSFCAFSIFWTTIAFLLAGAPYRYGDLVIGLFGLVGAAGALCANVAGRWADRDLAKITTTVFAGAIGLSFVVLWFGRSNLVFLIIGIVVLDIGVQGMMVTNQTLVYRLAPKSRSRLTSAYMVCYFSGGALGSAFGGWVYGAGGWDAVCALGVGTGSLLVVVSLLPGQPESTTARAIDRS